MNSSWGLSTAVFGTAYNDYCTMYTYVQKFGVDVLEKKTN